MSIREYLESAPFFGIVKYGGHDALNAVAFVGTPRKHPYDQEKCLLLTARQAEHPGDGEASLIEFRMNDVLAIEELPSPVDESGTARSLAKLWVKRGAIAVRYEPFEVADRPLGPRESPALRARYSWTWRQQDQES
jgi:hypothetical protein